MRIGNMINPLLCFLILLTLLQGCNTLQGMGRDIEEAGDAIEDAAE